MTKRIKEIQLQILDQKYFTTPMQVFQEIQRLVEVMNILMKTCSQEDRIRINKPQDVYDLMPEASGLEEEHLWVIGCDTRNKVRFKEMLYQGSLNQSTVRVAEIFKRPLIEKCSAIVIVHNHPSGDPTPSSEDIQLTRAVNQAGKLMDIDLLDHVIIGKNRYISLKERNLGFS